MIREEFNKLDINNQVNYYNEQLKDENNNFNAICKSIGISKNTILGRFKKAGYEPAKEGQKIIYFCMGEEVNSKNFEPVAPAGEKEKKIKMKASDPKELDLILKRIELLEHEVEELKGKRVKVLDDDFILSDFSGVTTTKTFKIDIEVYKELEKVLNKYSMYKKQDVVSSLIKFALENINK